MVPGSSWSPASAARRAAPLGLGVASIGLLAWNLRVHPTELPVADWSGLVWPDAGDLFRVSRAFGVWLALNAAAAGVGCALARVLPAPDRLSALRNLALGFAILASAVLGLAALGLLAPPFLALLLALGAAGGATALGRGRRLPRPPGDRRRRGPLLALVALLLLPPLLRSFGPDPGWDALTYHLAVPERYLFGNGIWVTPLSVFSVFPLLVGMLNTIALAFDAAPAAGLLHLEFGVLCAVVVFELAARRSARAGWLAVAVLAADPLFVWELGTAYNDLAACFFTLLAAASLPAAREGDRRALLACGALAGAAAAVRYPSWGLPLALAVLLWCPTPRGRVRSRCLDTAWLLVPVALVLLPWLLRNLLFTGNPVAPAFQGWLPGPGYFEPRALEQNAALLRGIGPGRSPGDLLALPWNLVMRARSGDYGAFGYPVGVLYALSLLAVVAAAVRGRAAGVADWVGLSGLLTLFWFVTAQEPRYLLPALLLLAVAGGRAADALWPRGGRARLWWGVPAVAILHAQLPWIAALPLLAGGALARGTDAAAEPARLVGEALRRELGPGDRVVLLFEPRGYFFRGLDYLPYHLNDGSPLLWRLHRAAREGAFDRLFAELGATHVVVNGAMPARHPPRFVAGYQPDDFRADVEALRGFLARHSEPVFRSGSVEARRLR